MCYFFNPLASTPLMKIGSIFAAGFVRCIYIFFANDERTQVNNKVIKYKNKVISRHEQCLVQNELSLFLDLE